MVWLGWYIICAKNDLQESAAEVDHQVSRRAVHSIENYAMLYEHVPASNFSSSTNKARGREKKRSRGGGRGTEAKGKLFVYSRISSEQHWGPFSCGRALGVFQEKGPHTVSHM